MDKMIVMGKKPFEKHTNYCKITCNQFSGVCLERRRGFHSDSDIETGIMQKSAHSRHHFRVETLPSGAFSLNLTTADRELSLNPTSLGCRLKDEKMRPDPGPYLVRFDQTCDQKPGTLDITAQLRPIHQNLAKPLFLPLIEKDPIGKWAPRKVLQWTKVHLLRGQNRILWVFCSWCSPVGDGRKWVPQWSPPQAYSHTDSPPGTACWSLASSWCWARTGPRCSWHGHPRWAEAEIISNFDFVL